MIQNQKPNNARSTGFPGTPSIILEPSVPNEGPKLIPSPQQPGQPVSSQTENSDPKIPVKLVPLDKKPTVIPRNEPNEGPELIPQKS